MTSISGYGFIETSLNGGSDLNTIKTNLANVLLKNEDINMPTKNITANNINVNGTLTTINVSDVTIRDRTTVFGQGNSTNQNIALMCEGKDASNVLEYQGLMYDASERNIKAIKTKQNLVGAEVNEADATYTLANFKANNVEASTSLTVGNAITSDIFLCTFGTNIATSRASIQHDGTNLNINNSEAGYLRFLTSNTERMRIINSGNVGIGTTNPSARLHVNGGNIYITNGQIQVGGTTIGELLLSGQYIGLPQLGFTVNTGSRTSGTLYYDTNTHRIRFQANNSWRFVPPLIDETFNSNWNGPFANVACSIKLNKINDIVTFSILNTLAVVGSTSSSRIILNDPITATYRPNVLQHVPIRVYDSVGGGFQMGILEIDTNGSVNIYRTLNNNTFNSASTITVYATTVTYYTNV